MRLPVPVGVFEQHIAVLGKTRSGKSSVMRLLVEHLLERRHPVCILDPKGDWWGLRLSADGKAQGYPIVVFGDPHLAKYIDVAINGHVGADVAELVATGNRPSLIDFGGWTVAARTQFYIDFAETLFRRTVGDRWVVVDEIHNFGPKGSLKGTERNRMPEALHWTNRLASEGLGKGVHLVFASQRPQKVHNDTLTSAETLIAMRVLHPSDREAVSDWIAAAGDQSGKDVLASLADLDRGEGWAWSPEIKFGPDRIRFPLFSTYDSFKAQRTDTAKLKGWGDVDLGEINAKLAAVQEQKKADDPRELRKQIAELKKQLSVSSNQLPAPKAETKVVEKFVLKDGQLARAEKVLASIDAMLDRFQDAQEAFDAKRRAATSDLTVVSREIADAITKTREPHPNTHATMTPRVDRQVPVSPRVHRAVPAATASRPVHAVSRSSNGDMTGPERKILASLAELEALNLHPADKIQVGLMAGYTNVRSGGFSEPLGRLVAGGYVEIPRPGQVAITDAGRAAIGPVDPPANAEEMQARIKARIKDKLTGPERKLLDVLIAHYPTPITKEQLASECDPPYTNIRSGGFSEPLGRLNTLGIVHASRGEVVAAPALFLELR